MRIAIVKLSALGDIIHAMVVLQFIKKNIKDIKIDWVVEESYKELLEFHPDINKIHVVNFREAKKKKSVYLFLKELKKLRSFGTFDMVIDMQGLIKSAVVSRLISSQKTIGFDNSSLREGVASIFYNRVFKFDYERNIIERNLALIADTLNFNFFHKNIDEKMPFLYSSRNYLISSISLSLPNIILVPGASFKAKCLPVEMIAEIASKIDANFLIIWGNNQEKEMAIKIKKLSPKVEILHKMSLDELISLIGQVDLVLGPDTGPTHMAWALNIPSITLFGPTPGSRNTYITEINKIIESNSIVNPKKIDKNDESIKDIKTYDIVKITKQLLG